MRPPSVSTVVVLLLLAAPLHAGNASSVIKKLPRCPPRRTPAPVDGSKETQVRESFSLALPASCQREEGHQFIHGGNVWRCDEVAVQVGWGMWGASSFGESGTTTTCAEIVSGVRVMVVRDKADEGWVAVLYPTDEVHEPLVSARSERAEDRALVEAIVFSGKVKPRR
jgi:hypothetical protein